MSYSNGGYRGGGHPRRSRYEDQEPQQSPEERKQQEISSYLFRLGDAGSEGHDQTVAVNAIATRLDKDHGAYPDLVKSAINACITQVPQKTCIYGALVRVIESNGSPVAQTFVDVAGDALQTALNANDFRTVKIVLRFLAELMSRAIISPAQLITVYDLFLNVTNEPGVQVERADAFVFSILASIPWGAEQLNARAPEELSRIMGTVESYINARRETFSSTDIPYALEALSEYRDVPADWPYAPRDRLETLWNQIVDLKTADLWASRILYRLDLGPAPAIGQAAHALQEFSVTPSLVEVKFSYQPVLRIFDDSLMTPENAIIKLPSTNSISRYILEDMIYDIVRIFSHNHKEASRLLWQLESFLDGFFLEDGKISYLASVVETLFAEMLRLPRSGERGMYYTTLLMDLIKEDIQTVPKMIGRAVRTLYSRLDGPEHLGGGMDVEGIRRLSEWFAVHLSNFGHVWPWQSWEAVLNVEQTSASFVFVRETLERSTRLAYWERVQGSIPESFAQNAAIFPPHAPTTNFKFQDLEDSPKAELIATFRKSMAARTPAPELTTILQQIAQQPTTDGMSTSGEEDAREVLVQCVMLQGSKSFSHLLNIVERYVGLLRDYNTTEEAREHTVRIIADFWKHNTQFLEIVLDKFMNYRVLDPKSIYSWVLSPDVLDSNYTRFYFWSILRSTLAKVNLKVEQLTLKVQAAKKEQDSSDMDVDGDATAALDKNRSDALREQKEVFVQLFQKFVDVIREQYAVFESQGVDPTTTAWNRWVLGNMREVARGFPNEVKSYKVTLDMLVFREDIDARILKVWREIKGMYAIHTDTLV
ncbi:armadillo-type protein [Fimicolochytrium jonesii]|uniref:armadillo-type protein n=1 Tax=Fimicolochytrium jonesii TaxID=1396493 RepID=UPI0022FE88D8|nr:armadillo-type protein [Fimicolochytrium jonesii]KAI8816755.1 armadillo-type protein [Fimicolochytrium jonesii]